MSALPIHPSCEEYQNIDVIYDSISFEVIEADVFASALVEFLEENDGNWRGSTTELRESLTARAADKVARSQSWPLTTAATTAALNRVKDALESVGSRSSAAVRAQKTTSGFFNSPG